MLCQRHDGSFISAIVGAQLIAARELYVIPNTMLIVDSKVSGKIVSKSHVPDQEV